MRNVKLTALLLLLFCSGKATVSAERNVPATLEIGSRLEPLIDLGLEHVYQLGGSPVAHPHGARQVAMVEQAKLFASHVMPHFR